MVVMARVMQLAAQARGQSAARGPMAKRLECPPPLNAGSIWSVFLPIDPQCDFGVCSSTGETWLQTRTPGQNQDPFDIQWIRDAGRIIGIRLFDWAGRAWRDIDFHGHGNNGPGNPHEHPWDWSKKYPRQPPVPITPTSIPGPFLIIIDPCILEPWQSWCKHGPGPSADENLKEPLELLKKEKVAEFARLPWHDAKLLEVKLFRDEILDLDNLSCSIDFGAGPKSFRRAIVSFLSCTIVKIDLDLDGKRVCADSISNATCEIDSALEQSLEAGSLQSENKPLSEFYHFRVAMIPPGGDLNVFAKDFEVLWAG